MSDVKEGYVPFGDYQTYYRIKGTHYTKTPLLILHGGPGSTHNAYEILDGFADMAKRPVILYDQFGCGLSTPKIEKPELYTAETWVRELINLRNRLGLDEIHLMGHSWGGMLSIIYLTDYHPEGIKSVVLSSTLSSASLWAKETHRLLRYLSKEDQEAVKKAEEENDYTSLEFLQANSHYLKMTVADIDRQDPSTPECLKRKKVGGSLAYLTAWGPSEFRPLGNLATYEYTSKLPLITCPVMLVSGTDDESTPLQNKVMFENLTGTKAKAWTLLDHSRHMTYYEQKEEYEAMLKDFLDEKEA